MPLTLVLVSLVFIGGFFTHRGMVNWQRQYFLDQALWQAVENNDTGAVQKALVNGADPNSGGDAGLGERHPLITAQANGDLKMVNVLQAHGANASQALMIALDAKETERLLHIGAKMNGVTDEFGKTALGGQSANGRPDIVRLLLAHGADPGQKDKDGRTALDRANYAAGNHPEMAAAYSEIIKMLKDAEKSRTESVHIR